MKGVQLQTFDKEAWVGSSMLVQQDQGCCESKTTVTISLERRRDALRTQLAEVERVLAIVTKHPEVQEVFDAVSSIRGII